MADESGAAGRIAAAVRGRPPGAYAEVLAADIAAVAALVPEGKHTAHTRALAKGARHAPARLDDGGEPAPCPLLAEAGKLVELLEAAGADTE